MKTWSSLKLLFTVKLSKYCNFHLTKNMRGRSSGSDINCIM